MKDKRFVIQEHQTSEDVHWDLMLEQDDVLTTFRLAVGRASPLALSCEDARPTRAERIFDHPLRFLWYEGPVQNGTGRVRIVDRGTWRLDDRRDECLTFHLHGQVLHGAFALVRTGQAEWRFERSDRNGRSGES